MQRLEHSLEPEPIKRQCHDQQKDENATNAQVVDHRHKACRGITGEDSWEELREDDGGRRETRPLRRERATTDPITPPAIQVEFIRCDRVRKFGEVPSFAAPCPSKVPRVWHSSVRERDSDRTSWTVTT